MSDTNNNKITFKFRKITIKGKEYKYKDVASLSKKLKKTEAETKKLIKENKKISKNKKVFNKVLNDINNLKNNTITIKFNPNKTGSKYSYKNMNLQNNLLLRNIIKQEGYEGQYKIVINNSRTGINHEGIYFIDKNFWKKYKTKFQQDSQFNEWNDNLETGDEVSFAFTKALKIPLKTIKQSFLDGSVSHCLLEPIFQYFNELLDDAKTEGTMKVYKAKTNKIKKYLEIYKDGIPETHIKDLCEDLKIGIEIQQPFCETVLINERSTKPRKTFKYVNSRVNHVERSFNLFSKNNPITKTEDEMKQIKKDCKKELCIYTKGLSTILTKDTYYVKQDDFFETKNEWEYDMGFNGIEIDAKVCKDEMEFIDAGTHFNGTVDFIDTSCYKYSYSNIVVEVPDEPEEPIDVDEEPVTEPIDKMRNIPKNMKHIDITKAYTQFKQFKNYNGFLGLITDFRKIDHYNYKGFYKIVEVNHNNIKDHNLKRILLKLGWFIESNVYTDDELRWFEEIGGTFKVVYGLYGFKFDFDFNEDMTTKKTNGIPYYSKWCGMSTSTNTHKNEYIDIDNAKYLMNLRTENSTEIHYLENDKIAQISTEKPAINNKKHITAFIMAYQRLNLIEQLKKINYDNIVRVCVDGIYYTEPNEPFKIDNIFSDKSEKMTFENDPSDTYLSEILDDVKITNNEPREFYETELHLGAGGCGKTYYNLNDRGIVSNKMVFVAQSYDLANSMKREYPHINISVQARLLATQFKDKFQRYSTIVIDECSMLTEENKEYILENFKGRKIIFMGDLQAQLTPIDGDQMTSKGIQYIKKFTNNYRFKCDKIIKLTDTVRKKINKKLDFKALGIQTITKEELKIKYNHKTDIILRLHNELNKQNKNLKQNYTDEFKSLEKYKITENKKVGDIQYNNGNIVYEKPQKVKYELRHGFTIHSVQGRTYCGNIFIDPLRFDNRLFYTAISRAKYHSQIYLII